MRSVFVMLLLVCAVASAEESSWGLRWNSPADCIDAARLAQAVEARLGKHVFGMTPNFRVDGNITSSNSTWHAVFTISDDKGTVLGSRDVFGKGDCRSLDDNLVFVLTMLIDPRIQPLAVEPSAPVAEHAVQLHLKSTGRSQWSPTVQLKRTVPEGARIGARNLNSDDESECEAPCDKLVVNGDQQFMIDGPGVRPSTTFVLSEHAINGDVSLTVRPGNKHAFRAGVALAAVGVASALTGGITYGMTKANVAPNLFPSAFEPVSIGLIVGGALLSVIGVPLFIENLTKLIWNDTRTPAALTALR